MYCWDGELLSTRRFVGHTKDVLYVALSIDNRQIVSASCDGTIKLWNTLGECKYTISDQGEGHKQWVSCVRFSPNTLVPTIVSASWDHTIKLLVVRKMVRSCFGILLKGRSFTLLRQARLSTLYPLVPIDTGCELRWRIALEYGILRARVLLRIRRAEAEKSDSSAGTRNETKVIYCKWSADGDTLFSGYTDEVIRVWGFLSLLEKKRRHDDHSNFFYRFKWLLFCTSELMFPRYAM
ncbi:hypothetical protein HID58_079459 [Brassica napus]|uniref:Uncharacterized protein n=1 Tax=Brassica napus TaxID=3708 RepID=A0ABQ7Y227_BRANA|nr:hypothetical protein HID58_079459 [Brassica napus]